MRRKNYLQTGSRQPHQCPRHPADVGRIQICLGFVPEKRLAFFCKRAAPNQIHQRRQLAKAFRHQWALGSAAVTADKSQTARVEGHLAPQLTLQLSHHTRQEGRHSRELGAIYAAGQVAVCGVELDFIAFKQCNQALVHRHDFLARDE